MAASAADLDERRLDEVAGPLEQRCRRPAPRPPGRGPGRAPASCRRRRPASISGPIRVPSAERVADGDLPRRPRPAAWRARRRSPRWRISRRSDGAALAGGAHGGEQDRPGDQVEVGVVHHDDGVVAAELEQRAAEALGHHLARPSRRPRSSRSPRSAGGGGRRPCVSPTHGAGADHQVEDAVEPGAGHHARRRCWSRRWRSAASGCDGFQIIGVAAHGGDARRSRPTPRRGS